MKKYNIKEIFYSLQGEGANIGRPSIFIRLSACNLACSFCDTDFTQGTPYTAEEIAAQIAIYPARFIIWTGGEPTLSLDDDIIRLFKSKGYTQAIETNGTHPVSQGIDYICCSPKTSNLALLHKLFPNGVDEWRYPVGSVGPLPPAIDLLPPAKAYFVSPIFIGKDHSEKDEAAIERCMQFVLKNPDWRLSVQTHKLLNFL